MGLDRYIHKIYKKGMRNHNRAVLLRLTETDFLTLQTRASMESLTVQEFLRDLLKYGDLPRVASVVDKKKAKKDLTS